MDLIVYLLGFTLIISHSEGNAKFTSNPLSVVYVSSGEVATLTWNYIVQDRLAEFKDHSPTWHLYLQNGTSIQLAYENKRTRKWTLSESCPSRLRNRLVINNSSSLVIKEATIEDSGTYGCTLNLTNRPPITSRANLNITGPEFTSPIPQTVMIREGKDLSINCKARDSPTPVVKWLRLEKERKVLITQGVGNAVLEKRNIRREFNGTYECQASNDANNPNVIISNRTDILVQYRPSIDSISSSPITIKSWDGNSLILRCMAEGDPIPKVSWIGPDKQPIKYGVSSSIGVSLLAIQTENSKDYGQYRCRASNSIGYVYRYIEVERIVVPDPPMILKIQSTASTIEITWRRPTLDGGSPIIDYQIAINTKPLRTVSVKGTSVVIDGLSKATKYQVNVLARNVVGYSSATSAYISTKKEDDMANEQMSENEARPNSSSNNNGEAIYMNNIAPQDQVSSIVIQNKAVSSQEQQQPTTQENENEARPNSSSNNNGEAIDMNNIAPQDQVSSIVIQNEAVSSQEQQQPTTQLYQTLLFPSDTYSPLSLSTKLPPRPAVITNSGVYQDLQDVTHQYQSLDNSIRA